MAPTGIKRGGSPPETDLWLPNDEAELRDYAKRKLDKERVDYRVEWLKYPLWQRVVYILFITLILVFFLMTAPKIF